MKAAKVVCLVALAWVAVFGALVLGGVLVSHGRYALAWICVLAGGCVAVWVAHIEGKLLAEADGEGGATE